MEVHQVSKQERSVQWSERRHGTRSLAWARRGGRDLGGLKHIPQRDWPTFITESMQDTGLVPDGPTDR